MYTFAIQCVLAHLSSLVRNEFYYLSWSPVTTPQITVLTWQRDTGRTECKITLRGYWDVQSYLEKWHKHACFLLPFIVSIILVLLRELSSVPTPIPFSRIQFARWIDTLLFDSAREKFQSGWWKIKNKDDKWKKIERKQNLKYKFKGDKI